MKKTHNVKKENLSRKQFCNLFNNLNKIKANLSRKQFFNLFNNFVKHFSRAKKYRKNIAHFSSVSGSILEKINPDPDPGHEHFLQFY